MPEPARSERHIRTFTPSPRSRASSSKEDAMAKNTETPSADDFYDPAIDGDNADHNGGQK